MWAHQPLLRSWGSVLALLSGSVVSMGIVARAANAEGVVNGGAFGTSGIDSRINSTGSLIDVLGDSHLQAVAVADGSRQASRVQARPASPRELASAAAEVGGDMFRHSRLALPLVMQSAVGDSGDAALPAAAIRSMTGPMVGLKAHPRTWGSTLDR